jgi:hypothetical protein
MYFDITQWTKWESILNMFQTCFIVIVLAVGSAMFSKGEGYNTDFQGIGVELKADHHGIILSELMKIEKNSSESTQALTLLHLILPASSQPHELS